MKSKDIFLAIFVVFTWGSYFTVSKIAFSGVPPLLLSALRYFLLFLVTSPFLFKEKIPIKQLFYISSLLFWDLLAINYAIHFSSNLTPIILINQLTIPIASLLGIYILKEAVNFKDFVGIVIALIGIVIVLKFRSTEEVTLVAVIFAFAASILFAYYNLYVKILSKFNFLTVIANMSLWVFPQFLIASVLFEDWACVEIFNMKSLLSLLYIVLVISLLSYYLWFYLLNKYAMSKIVPFILLMPVFGCLISSFAFDNQIDNKVIFGGSLVILGLAIIELRIKNYAQKKL